MINHKIYVRRRRQDIGRTLQIPLIRRCIRTALDAQGVDVPCEVSVLITDDNGIQQLNNEFRGIDAATDVLSFPLQNLVPGAFKADECEISPENGLFPLGDIVLSADHVCAQAKEFGSTDDREMAYLVIHSVLHLLGYDHMDEGEQKKAMRDREKVILKGIGYES